jgi:hypothetical protein
VPAHSAASFFHDNLQDFAMHSAISRAGRVAVVKWRDGTEFGQRIPAEQSAIRDAPC